MNRLAFATLAIAASTACAQPDAAGEKLADSTAATAASPATTAGRPDGLVAGTPAGGLEEWIDDITSGLKGLTEKAAADPPGAQRQALDLYVGRQEYIEIYWGTQGRLKPSTRAEELAGDVVDQETAFHDVLQTLTATPVDTSKLAQQLDTLNARLARTLSMAKQAGATMVPPGNSRAGSDVQ
jgi:hypothetical protein